MGGNTTGIDQTELQKDIKRVTGGGINPFEETGNLPGGAYNPLPELSPFRKALATILPFGDPGYVEGGLYNTMLGGGDGSALSPYLGEEGDRRVNPLYPLGIGAAVGKYVSG